MVVVVGSGNEGGSGRSSSSNAGSTGAAVAAVVNAAVVHCLCGEGVGGQ